MNTFYFCIVAFVAGVPTAWAFGKYLLSVEERKALSAAMWDMVILGLSTLVTLTLWSKSGDSPFVFLGWLIGNAFGTFLVVKRAQRQVN